MTYTPKTNIIVTDRILGRDTAGTGDPEQLSLDDSLEFTGAGGIQRAALTGDVTAAAGSNATTITDNAVTDAKLRDSTALSVIGRSANSTGDPADIIATTDGYVLRRSGTTLGFGTIPSTSITGLAAVATSGSASDLSTGTLPDARMPALTGDITTTIGTTTTAIAPGVIINADVNASAAIEFSKLQTMTTDRILGRDTAGTGAVEQLTVSGGLEFTGTGIQRSALTGDVTATAGSNATTIAVNTVTDTKLRDSVALSVIGRSVNSTGDPADIAAATDGYALRRSGVTIGFGTIETAGISDDAITYAKIQNISTTDRLLGLDGAAPGNVTEIALATSLEFTGSNSIQRSALTGDVTASAGSNATTIAANAVTDTKLRDSIALSVIGRSVNSTGDPADIAASVDGYVLRRSGTTLGFSTIETSGVADDAITYAKIQNISTTDRLLGLDGAAPGNVTEISLATSLEFTGSNSIQRSALTGDVTASAGSNATTIAANAVTNTKLRDSVALSVIGRSSNSTGDPADISASTDGYVLRRSGTTLGFGPVLSTAVDLNTAGFNRLLSASNTTAQSAFDTIDNNILVDAFSNIAVGALALDANTIGTNNTAVGTDALGTNISGSFNTALGASALSLSTTSNNTAIGYSAGSALTTGTQNTALGSYALTTATTALNNVAVGQSALGSVTAGFTLSGAVAVGVGALNGSLNTGAADLVAVGEAALAANSTGSANVAVGSRALEINTSGIWNTAVGADSLRGNIVGNYNTAVGESALRQSTASNNTGIGTEAAQALTTGAGNTVLGAFALDSATTALNNVGIGLNALGAITAGFALDGAVAIGQGALSGVLNTGALDLVAVGQSALAANTTGASNTAVGSRALDANTTGTRNTAFGVNALGANISGIESVAIGYQAALLSTASAITAVGSNALDANTSGMWNTAIGYNALSAISTSGSSTAVGFGALEVATGGENTAVGAFALDANTDGTNNTGIGYGALSTNISGTNNTAVGTLALSTSTGSNSTAVGYTALNSVTTGSNNVAIGSQALTTVSTASGNTAVGREAGKVQTGANNTYLGYQAGDAAGSGDNNIVIGYDAQKSTSTASNEITIGNISHTLTRFLNDGYVAMTLSSGRLGLGVTPTSQFHVKSFGEIVALETTGATGNNYLRFKNATVNLGYIGFGSAANNNLSIANDITGANIGFVTNAATRLTIDATAITSTLPILNASGAVGAPAYSFSSASTSGMFYDSVNGTINITSTGTTVMGFGSTAMTSLVTGGPWVARAAGSINAPTYSFNGDTNTGYYNPAANTLSAVCGGIGRHSMAGTVTTTDAATTDIITIPTASDTSYSVIWQVVARQSTGAVNSYISNVRIKNVAGTVTVTLSITSANEENATPTLAAIGSGTNALLRVSGVAATTFTWTAWADIIQTP